MANNNDSIIHNQFYAGISPYKKIATANGKAQARFIQNLNIHEDPSEITLSPALAKISSTTVTALPKWLETGTPWDTNKYSYDADGNLYSISSSDVVTLIRAGSTIANGAAGQGLLAFDDYLYYPTSTTIGRYGKLSGSPAFNDDFLSDGTTNVDQELVASGQTYTVPTSISEVATARQTFVPTRDPLKSIIILVAAKGTGDWTVTVHDSADTLIGSATLATASVTGSANNTFTFSTPLRLIIDNTYHFHVTVTTGTSTVTTGTSADLETVDFQTLFGILVADTLWHPAINHLNLALFANERYIGVWDQATYNPNALTLPAGFKIRSWTKVQEYAVAAAWRGSTIDGTEEGRHYYWDGITDTFNFYDTINLGLPNVVHNSKNRLFSINGSRGMIHLGNEPFKKVQEAPQLARGKKVEIYPGGVTEWQGRTYFGIGSTDDASFRNGIYEYGNRDDNLPEALTLGMIPTTGTNQSTTFQVGAIKAFGSSLYAGFKYSTAAYGIEKVSKTSIAATSGTIEFMIYDNGQPQKDKAPTKLVISFLPLVSGESVTPKFKLNRATSFTDGDTISAVGSTRAELAIDPQGRAIDIEYGCTVASSGGTYLTITGAYFMVDPLKKEAEEGTQ